MSTLLSNDNYGRQVSMEVEGSYDVYTVLDLNTQATFSVSFPIGSSQAAAYQTINAMPAHAPALSPVQTYTAVVQAAIQFGQQLTVQFAVANILGGITQAGKTQAMIDYASNLSTCLGSGSLYAAIDDINVMIADNSPEKLALSPFITNSILTSYKNQIQSYLGLPNT